MSIASVLPPAREFRDIQVKVHIRRPERDSWAYLGRALVSQEVVGQSSRVGECHIVRQITFDLQSYPHVVIRSLTSGKVLVAFGEVASLPYFPAVVNLNVLTQVSELQAEKRGNFVVVGCVEGSRVVSWSLNVIVWPS